MSQALIGRMAVRAKRIQPGQAFAAEVHAGHLIEITDLFGQQVAEFVAFGRDDRGEKLSLGVTRAENGSIMLQTGMKLFANNRRELLELVEDSVGRHDLLYGASGAVNQAEAATVSAATVEVTAIAPASSDDGVPVTGAADETPAIEGSSEAQSNGAEPEATDDVEARGDTAGDGSGPITANGASHTPPDPASDATNAAVVPQQSRDIATVLEEFQLTLDDLPDPVNWFMNVAIKQRGELEIREPLSERGDHVVLRALTDLVVIVRSSSRTDISNAENPTDLLVRVYR